MTNTKTPPAAGAAANPPRRPRSRKVDTTGARALLAALAVSATLGGWAVIAKDSQSAATAVADPLASSTTVMAPATDALQLTPLPTVVAAPSGLDQIASSQLAPLDAPVLQQAPLSSAASVVRLRPLARSRSSN